jgi:dienelactone hydrolase
MTINRGVLGIAALAGVLVWGLSHVMIAGAQAAEQKLGQAVGLIRENVIIPFSRPDNPPYKLDAVLTRPATPGRYPLMIISHGSPRDATQRAESRPTTYSAIAVEFARRGWVTVAVMRRGYGRSEGEYVEGNPCDNPNYERTGLISSQELTATVINMKDKDYIDPKRYMFVGVSAGGFASIAAASLPRDGLMGVVNFAGGRGSNAPDSVCRGDRLVNAMGTFGKTARVPTLWIYAENDHFFSPKLAQGMFNAFKSSGGVGEFVAAAPFGEDGHVLFTGNGGMKIWLPMVSDFFIKNGFPIARNPATDPTVKLAIPADASANAKKDFPNYLASNGFEKAFAIAPNGKGFSWRSGLRTPEEAAAAVLKACASGTGATCKIYAINNELVGD